ncbi:MAG: hypothetical protein COW62_00355 [Zetaproteobacteria bacterium CG17_big_fil_post_rev_8_21_14_2_50_50_13]|nr:MAG: hypothetical protein AUJ56_01980 [Zetaproteobacteria bacterium CG1_02_49_23]PIQ34852.1 MAG: hypothetical protein COW62_00355 [Zetaproteobacteria bacterium CG17_big_fil_post_rev_8_21_14_2_50_50_13]PIY55824.1 MAG: hypothetical protein COZ00_07715 [Zetaproteobacteria bacterium CG_4_10_14_0_8_um_filter_49_80]
MLAIFSIRRTAEVLRINRMLAIKNSELESAMNEIKVLKGILPICSYCKRIKDPEDESWKQIESYIDDHSEAQFSHSICPDCYNIPLRELEDFKTD